MKSMKTGAVSGCLVWVILILFVSSCIVPASFFVGSFTSVTTPAVRLTGGIICPAETTPKIHSYATTSVDDIGVSHLATGYELQCLDASGNVVKTDPVGYVFLWDAIIVAAGLVVTIIISLLIAAPAGAIIARWLDRIKVRNRAAQK